MLLIQELRSREEELCKAAEEQKLQDQFLRKREQELAEREIELVERELNIMILQQMMNKPTPKNRKGKFNKKNLKLLKARGGKEISRPSGVCLELWIQLFKSLPISHQHSQKKKQKTKIGYLNVKFY